MTPQEQQKYIAQLKSDIAILEAFKAKVEKRQVDFPLDSNSQKVIQQDIATPTGRTVIPYNLATYDESIEIDINGKRYYLYSTSIQ